MLYKETDPDYERRKKEWDEIEDLVLTFQKQFENTKYRRQSDAAAIKLLEKFQPLTHKYVNLLITGQINWHDKEMKLFVYNFISDKTLQRALKSGIQSNDKRSEIYSSFNFIKETYGSLPKDEIKLDLDMLLLVLAKRYKKTNRNFCSYVYNAYRFEVCRHIKAYIKDPINISYKQIEYDDCINGEIDDPDLEKACEDTYYEDLTGLPDRDWIEGIDCSDIFKCLEPLDRRIIIKYYLEEWKDRQIAEFFGMHINTVNQRRRNATKMLASNLGLDFSKIKRTRRSGKNAIIPTMI